MNSDFPKDPPNGRRSETAGGTPGDEPRLLPRQLRAALLRDLTPTRAERERVHAGILGVIGGARASALIGQADAEMAARAAQLKTVGVIATKSLATKIIVSGLVLASAAAVTTGVVVKRGEERRPVAAAVGSQSTEPLAEHSGSQLAPPLAAAPAVIAAPPLEAAPPVSVDPPLAAARSSASPSDRHAAGLWSGTAPASRAANHRARATSASNSVAEQVAPLVAATNAEIASENTSNLPPSDAAARTVAVAAQPNTGTSKAATAAVRVGAVASKPSLALADELALVRGASDALDRKDSRTALGLLARYEQKYPDGSLELEARALHVIALCIAKRPEATRAREVFVNAHAGSALARRVRSACP